MNEIIRLVEDRQFVKALPLIEDALRDNPDDLFHLNLAGMCWNELNNEATANVFFQRCNQVSKDNPLVLVNIGRSLHDMGRYQEAMSYFLKAAEINPNYAMAYSNAAASMVQLAQWDDAEKCCKLALDCDPDEINARMNLASCLLAKGELGQGWDQFELSLGSKYRTEISYGDESRWDGTQDQTVVVYGEQGLGDEIYLCEAIPDACGGNRIVIDCDSRLETLFRRSFPDAKVFGTRRADKVDWLDCVKVDARCSMASLQRFYRRSKEDYKLKPYLKADPEKVLMWRALFSSFKKPVIGICSTSGTRRNNESGRTITEDDWKPFIDSHDAVYVSLDYKGKDPAFCRTYHFATRSPDYDDTAALIAALDAVVGVCTTALHCADALGIPTITLVPDRHTWKFAGGIPYFPTQEVIHQNGKPWKEVIRGIDLGRLPKAA